MKTARSTMRNLGPLTRGGKRTPIGLDVGTEMLRAVQLEVQLGTPGRSSINGAPPHAPEEGTTRTKLDYRIRGMTEAVRTPAPQDASPEECRSLLAEDIGRLLGRGNLRGTGVVLGLDPPVIELHPLSIPLAEMDVEDEKFVCALRFEMGRHLSYEPEQAEARAWRLPPGTSLAPTLMGVCAPRERVAEWVHDIEGLGCQCLRVDAAACALAQGCIVSQEPTLDAIWAILDLGSRSTRLVVVVRDVPILQREIPCGGKPFAEHVAKDLNVSAEAARQLMLDHGIGAQRLAGCPTSALSEPAQHHPADAEAQQVADLVFAAIRRDLTALAGEVERSLAYAMHVYGELQVSCVHLAGGGSGLRGLGPFLSQAIGVPVTVADALGTDAPPHSAPGNGGAWVKPVGLALLDFA